MKILTKLLRMKRKQRARELRAEVGAEEKARGRGVGEVVLAVAKGMKERNLIKKRKRKRIKERKQTEEAHRMVQERFLRTQNMLVARAPLTSWRREQ